MRCTSSRSRFSTRSTGKRRAHPGVVTVDTTGEVHRGGQDRSAGAQRQGRRAGRHRGALAEELDLGSTALEIAVSEQADHVVVTEGPHHGGPGPGAERHDVHPERRAQLDEPLEEFRRVDLLDDHRDLMALLGDPAARPLPSAEVRQHEDHAVSLRQCRRRCSRSRPRRTLARRWRRTGSGAGSSRASSGHRSRTPPGRHDAVGHRGASGRPVGDAREIIARRSRLAKLAPNPNGVVSPAATRAGINCAAAAPNRYDDVVARSVKRRGSVIGRAATSQVGRRGDARAPTLGSCDTPTLAP